MRQQLIDAVLERIKVDILDGDVTGIECLIEGLPNGTLIAYLPDDEQSDFDTMDQNETEED